jgi:branched-chain amino acid transport system permease protein
VEILIQGILLGGLYATAALGLSLVFGTIRLVNLAHGQFLVVGAYLTTILIAMVGGDPLVMAIPVAILMALVAYPLQRYVFTPVMSQGEEAPVVATFGVGIAVQTILVLMFTSNPRSLNAPYATDKIEILGFSIRISLLIALVIGIAIAVVLTLVLKKTQFGRQIRAASADAEAAGVVGIDVKKTYARVMAISAATASIAGVLIALSFAISPESGTGWLLRAFTVIVIGGLGSLPGTILGAMVVGIIETAGAATIGGEYRDLVVFGVLVLILIFRPNGLFAKTVKQ